ncbi:MAG: sulfite exporter TauE/SafE family protein [Rubrivivax sp.]
MQVSDLGNLGLSLVAELLALGIVSGFLAGLLGVGGGMMMVPFLTFILSQRGVEPGLAVKMAIATSMATILFTSLSSVRAHHKLGAVRWDLLRGLAPGIVLGGLAGGAGVFAIVKGRGLALFFAVFIGYSALQMLLDRKPKPGRQMPGPLGQTAVGGGIGLLSGLVGAGGAFMSVPFMLWCNVPIRLAVGTSAALGFPIALANTVGYVVSGWSLPAALPGAMGYLYLPALAIIAAASMTMAPIGARTAHRSDVKKLKRLFACLLFGLAAYMLTRAFA